MTDVGKIRPGVKIMPLQQDNRPKQKRQGKEKEDRPENIENKIEKNHRVDERI